MPEVDGQPKMRSAGVAQPADMAAVITNKTVAPVVSSVAAEETKKNDQTVTDVGNQEPPDQQVAEDTPIQSTPAIEPPKPLTDDEIRAEYEKRFPKTLEPTAEQVAAREKEFDKRMLDLYVAMGRSGEEYYKIKEVAQADLTELSQSELVQELKAQGFDEKTIEAMKIERYYQLNPDEIEQGFDESEGDFEERKELVKKKVAYGTEKLTKRSLQKQKNAQDILNTLKEGVAEQDLQKQKDAEFIAKIDEVSKAMPRKLTLQLGKLNNEDLGSVDVDIPESEIEGIVVSLKDPVQRKQLLFTEEGDLDIEKVSNLLIRNKILELSAREALFTGRTQEVEKFKKVFPMRDPHSIGVGSPAAFIRTGTGQKGKLASAGTPEIVNTPQRHRSSSAGR